MELSGCVVHEIADVKDDVVFSEHKISSVTFIINLSVWYFPHTQLYLRVVFMQGEWLLGVLYLLVSYIVLYFWHVLLSGLKFV
jgi:hypothetical protein